MNNLLNKLINNPAALSAVESEKLLDELRQEIDKLDKHIAELLIKRISVTLYIARVKQTAGLALYSPEREKEIMENVLASVSDETSRRTLRNIYERIIDESRGLQKMSTGNAK